MQYHVHMKLKKTHLLAVLFTLWCFLAGCAVAGGIVSFWGQALGPLFNAPTAGELLSGRVRFGAGMAFMAAVAHLCAHVFPRSVPTFTRTLYYFIFSAAICTGQILMMRSVCVDFVNLQTSVNFGPAPTVRIFPLFKFPVYSALLTLLGAFALRFIASRLLPRLLQAMQLPSQTSSEQAQSSR